MTTPLFNVGLQFTPIGKSKAVYTITDILTTYNLAKEVVRVEYECVHTLAGCNIKSRECHTTIARSIKPL